MNANRVMVGRAEQTTFKKAAQYRDSLGVHVIGKCRITVNHPRLAPELGEAMNNTALPLGSTNPIPTKDFAYAATVDEGLTGTERRTVFRNQSEYATVEIFSKNSSRLPEENEAPKWWSSANDSKSDSANIAESLLMFVDTRRFA
ncbi:unnamed protein product [Angiostrongylus costaricensis]|uniref:HK97 gp10 family phage protein n=1 Tax=Angiostrongylus costaricensis TaxID=334426 RepID=A0A0R3PV90_ANGCS|nr:unnamed protein product [Angiostrongylus costaricensis]